MQKGASAARRGGTWRKVALAFGGLLVLLALVNGAMLVVYRHRVLPRYELGVKNVGNLSYAQLSQLHESEILPPSLKFSKGTATVVRSPQALGVHVDMVATIQHIQNSRSWLPIADLFEGHRAALQLTVNNTQYTAAVNNLASSFVKAPQNDRIVYSGQQFAIEKGSDGYHLDQSAFWQAVKVTLQAGRPDMTVPTSAISSDVSANLSQDLRQLQRALSTRVMFSYQGKTVQPSKQDIGGWYVADGQSMAPARVKVAAYVSQAAADLQTTVANPNDLADATSYVLSEGLTRTFALVPANTKYVRTYCTATLDESDANLSDLVGKLAATYNDIRGWNNGGKIAFKHVSSGCQYTVWLSAANKMTSFGAICDDYYNCQVGTNVVLNYDRWTSATPPWNKTGGSLEDYRTLMIDHETGHRLGFLDNPTCPGSGRPAPVMMQQSIDLKGCTFNVWPLAAEFGQLDSMLDISSSPITVND